MRQHRSIVRRARRGAAVALVAAAALTATACDATEDLLEVSDPDIVNPEDIQTVQGANALRLGALARLNTATTGGEGTYLLGGLLADEWRSSDTFLQRNETDRRAIDPSNGNITTAFRSLYRARLSAEQAIQALQQFEDVPEWQIAQMYLVQAFVTNQLGEDFCGHIPFSTVVEGREELGMPLNTVETFERALQNVDSALTLVTGSTAAQATEIEYAAQVVKGRILMNLGRYEEAEAAVDGVPTDFAWVTEHTDNTNLNAIWSLNNSIGRWYVSQGEGTNGIDFVTPDDPRVPTCTLPDKTGCSSDTPVSTPFDPSTPVIDDVELIIQQKWPTRYSEVAIVSGIEARLIEAEAHLEAGETAAALAALNTLRGTVSGLDPLSSVNQETLFRERAFWLFGTGHRLGDLRRLVRQYGEPASAVYPTGTWWKGGEYGNDVNLPVPQAEENNPNFSRASCVTTEA